MALNDHLSEARTGTGFNSLTKPQQTAVVVLALLAVTIIIFWVWQVRTHINRPFTYNQAQPRAADLAGGDSSAMAILKTIDTDGDGLSDYDEIYIYGTSPYLEDTDGDGISDYDEVRRGTDPLCPEGRTCVGGSEISDPDLPNVIAPLTDQSADESAVYSGLNDQTAQQILSGEIDAGLLRQILLSTGVATADTLDQISDEELVNSYQEALKNQN